MLEEAHLNSSARKAAPEPMPVDIVEWASELHFSNFANSYAQYRDITSLENVRRILIIGPGQGLDTAIFRWRGYDVVTLDIDERLQPDVVGSAHDLSAFSDKSFDAIIASHVLEHVPPAYLDLAIAELARVAHHSLIYLPVPGRILRLRVMPGFGGRDWSWALHLYNPFNRPDPQRPKYCADQHYWELGRPGFKKRELIKRLERHFKIRTNYLNPDWLPSYNFVLSALPATYS